MSTQTQTQVDLMKKVNKRIFEGLNRGDVNVFDETHAADAIWHGPGGREIKGRKGIKEMVKGYMTAFPDMRMTVEHVVAEGDTLATHWSVRGTNTGPLGDFPPTGKKCEIHGHIVARFERGKVAEEYEVFDELSMLQQLGLAD